MWAKDGELQQATEDWDGDSIVTIPEDSDDSNDMDYAPSEYAPTEESMTDHRPSAPPLEDEEPAMTTSQQGVFSRATSFFFSGRRGRSAAIGQGTSSGRGSSVGRGSSTGRGGSTGSSSSRRGRRRWVQC
jgi:hypothetical protein